MYLSHKIVTININRSKYNKEEKEDQKPLHNKLNKSERKQ